MRIIGSRGDGRPDVGKWTTGVAYEIWRMLWQALEILLDGYLPEEGIMVLCLILGVQQKDQHECCQGVSAFMLLARAWHYFQIPDPQLLSKSLLVDFINFRISCYLILKPKIQIE